MTTDLKNSETYILNNISFRVSSSKVISEYKIAQSYILNEVEFGEYSFSRTSKELALLLTDTISSWITKLEKRIISSKYSSHIDPKVVEEAIESSKLCTDYMIEVYTSRNDVFDDNITIGSTIVGGAMVFQKE